MTAAAPCRRYRRRLLVAGALLAAIAIACGAFGAHLLAARLDASAMQWWQTAVQYQFWNALALFALGLSSAPGKARGASLLLAGTILFCASLYLLALGAPRGLAVLTPVGGSLMISGWLGLAWWGWRLPR